MPTRSIPKATVFVILGGGGDLTWRKLIPALYNLFLVWETVPPADFPNYQAGTWGPEDAEILTARDGRAWVRPTFLQCREEMASCRVTMEPQE